MRESANPHFRSLLTFLRLFVALSAAIQSHCSSAPEDPADRISQLLQRLVSAPPDTCAVPWSPNLDAEVTEGSILEESSNLFLQQLNKSGADQISASAQATKALNEVKAESARTNPAWPEENRFHYELLSIPPAFVLKVGIGTHERYFAFGFPAKDDGGEPNRQWQQIGEDDLELDGPTPRDWIDLYPLHRSPSGDPRFLASIGFTGCAGSSGHLYDAREWNPDDVVGFSRIIEQKGARGMDEDFKGDNPSLKERFSPIGRLETTGPIIELPYCWFSAVDTWDNPSMCALDTYDLSGNTVKFQSRSYNRPDLLPIARAIAHAQDHDFPAVRGYCISDGVARKIMQVVPPSYFAGDLQVTRERPDRERVTMGDGDEFHVEKYGGRWLVVSFATGTN